MFVSGIALLPRLFGVSKRSFCLRPLRARGVVSAETIAFGPASGSLLRLLGFSKRSFAHVPHVPDLSFLLKCFVWLSERVDP